MKPRARAGRNQKRLAIFDIDGTIFRSSLLIELVRALVAEGIFKPDAEDVYRRAEEAWLNREGDYEAYINSVVAAFRKNVTGVRYGDLRRVAYKVVAAHRGRTYRFTRDLARELKKKGYYLLALSHSPKIVVDAFARAMGFNKVYGIMYAADREGPNGHFTGEILFRDIVKQKDKLVLRTIENAALAGGGGLTLRGSVGVGDTESDIPFLKLVARPICFNPNAKLYREARKRKWEVAVERKDVVYEI